MELRWLAFGGLCLGMALLIRGYFHATRKTTTRDRNHNLEDHPEVSTSPDGLSGDGHVHH